MRRVKKAAALTLAVAMVFSLAGCGRNAGNQTGKAQGAAAGSGKTRQGAWKQVQVRSQLRLAMWKRRTVQPIRPW